MMDSIMPVSAEMRVLADNLECAEHYPEARRLRRFAIAVEKLERALSEIGRDAREDMESAERRASEPTPEGDA